MMDVIEAIGVLRLNQEAQMAVVDATNNLVRQVMVYRQALLFYANTENYIDGAPQHSNPFDEGLLTYEDNGQYARQALGEDVPLSSALIRIPKAA